MKEPILSLLRSIYPPPEARQAQVAIASLLEEWTHPPTPPPRHLTERDAVLITYADQLQQPGSSPLQTLAAFATSHLRDCVSAVHLLPFYPWSSDDGFSVKDYCAVDPAFGSWEDVRQLGRSFDLMFDAVFNHLSAQSEWFQRFLQEDPEFREFFVTVDGNPDLSQVVRPRALPLLTRFPGARGPRQVWTTFSADQVDLNLRNPRVLLELLRVLLFYARQGARFIRLDAIAFLWKEIGTPCLHLPQTHALIQLMRAVLDQTAPWVLLITETNVPHADNVAYFGNGQNEAQLVYNFALAPLVLHSLATGNATALTRWATTLQTPSPETAFFNFLASHDGIGLNPARGLLSSTEINALVERTIRHGGRVSHKHNPDGSSSPYELNITWFDALNDPAAGETHETRVSRFLVSQAIMLALAGVPGIYFHSLFGSRNDRAAAEMTGIARRINRQKLERSTLESPLADPASHAATVFRRYRELLRARRGHPAFHPQARQEILDLGEPVFAVLRTALNGHDRVLCLHNLSPTQTTTRPSAALAPPSHGWTPLFGVLAEPPAPEPGVPLDPYQVLWLNHKTTNT